MRPATDRSARRDMKDAGALLREGLRSAIIRGSLGQSGEMADTADLKSATGLNPCGGSSPPSGTNIRVPRRAVRHFAAASHPQSSFRRTADLPGSTRSAAAAAGTVPRTARRWSFQGTEPPGRAPGHRGKLKRRSGDRARRRPRGRRAHKKKGGRRPCGLRPPKIKPGGFLLSRRRILQYPRRWGPSLPCSEWERVLPPLHGRRENPAPGEPGKKPTHSLG